MIAVDEERAATRGFDGLSERVLTVAGIYGPNASGKSNVLDAMAWLSMAVGTSLRGWESVPRDAHRFGNGPVCPSKFELELVVDGVRHAYRLEVDDSVVLFESLDSYPEKRRRNLFTRRKNEIDFRRGLDGTRSVRELLTPTTLVLSAATRVGHADLGRVGRTVANTRVLGLRRKPFLPSDRVGSFDSTISWRSDGDEASLVTLIGTPEGGPTATGRSLALELLRIADPAIDDVAIAEEESGRLGAPRRHLGLVHRGEGQPVIFDLDDASAGTRTWLRLMGQALAAFQYGRVLLLDEIDASLHPRLSARLIEIFQDPCTNTRGAQLVFTSHDTSLLNSLNRDEVWLTERAPDATTRLVGLAEFGGERVRKSLNLERAYLQGRFGAVPDVDQVSVRRALGLASQLGDGRADGRHSKRGPIA